MKKWIRKKSQTQILMIVYHPSDSHILAGIVPDILAFSKFPQAALPSEPCVTVVETKEVVSEQSEV